MIRSMRRRIGQPGSARSIRRIFASSYCSDVSTAGWETLFAISLKVVVACALLGNRTIRTIICALVSSYVKFAFLDSTSSKNTNGSPVTAVFKRNFLSSPWIPPASQASSNDLKKFSTSRPSVLVNCVSLSRYRQG